MMHGNSNITKKPQEEICCDLKEKGSLVIVIRKEDQ